MINPKLIDDVLNGNVPIKKAIFKDSETAIRTKEEIESSNGNYSFYCKKCGLSASFNSKEELKFYKKFHKTFGCDYEIKEANTIRYTKEIIPKTFNSFIELLETRRNYESPENQEK